MTTMRDSRDGGSVRSMVARLLGSSGKIEALEPRQMLSVELPTGTEWTNWGNRQVATIPNSYIVSFDRDFSTGNAEMFARDVAALLGRQVQSVRAIGRGAWAELTLDSSIDFSQAEFAKGRLIGFRSIEPNAAYEISRVPNDPFYSLQWGLDNVGQVIQGFAGTNGADISASTAWDTTIGSRNVVVGIIDTGVDITHPDLINNLYVNPGEIPGDGIDNDGNGYIDDVNGFDFGELDNNPSDDVGHGTHVAGIVGATGNNGIGITGVAWNVSILPLKIADANGRLSTAAIVAAHDYSTSMLERGVLLAATNNSYGLIAGDFYENQPDGFNAERDAIVRYIAAGGTFVAAAGNNGIDNDNPNARAYPASYNIPGVISVAATDNNDGLAGFSNYGARNVEIGAPGVGIYSTLPGGAYGFASGTSMASPMVAGAVGVLKTFKPNASAVEIREALVNSSDPLPALQGRVRSGGRLNLARALEIIGIEGPVVRSFTPGPVSGQVSISDNQPVRTMRFTFSKDIDPTLPGFGTSAITVRGDGADNTFGTGDDVVVPVSSVSLSSASNREVVVQLDLTSFPSQRLPIDKYKVTLANGAFRDTAGNRLNGTTTGGLDQDLDFSIISVVGDNEPNDTLLTATPVTFSASGEAVFSGATIGNGVAGNLDVDIYRIDLPRGGLITAEIVAQRLVTGSTLDSVVRLFNARGEQLAINDQFFGQDSYIDFFVNTGGTYYIAVSGFGNSAYNPEIAASGSSQSLGNYTLRVNTQLSQDDIVDLPASTNSVAGQTPFPLNIPRGNEPGEPTSTQGTTSAAIRVLDTREILDVNVRVNLQHTSVSDLVVSLIAPSGLEIQLFNRRGGNGDDFGTRNSSGQPLTYLTFDDEASISVTAGTAPYSGSFRPESPLGGFDGLRGNGLWTLRIVDSQAGDFGRLIDWGITFTFQNDIFGPFESNDTLVTADPIREFTGTGSSSRVAFVGDGGFGSLDRDIYRMTVNAGSSLNASVISDGTLDAALLVFDGAGNQILVANPAGTNNASISNYVFATGGEYFIAVSEASNVNYTPSVVGSGVAAASTGGYTLNIEVAAGVSDPALALEGNNVVAGFNQGGTFSGTRSNGGQAGLRFNNVEFLDAANRNTATVIGASHGGQGFTNTGPRGINQLPLTLVDQSDPANRHAIATGVYRGMRIDRALSYGVNDSFIAIDVELTNTTGSTLTGVSWMEMFNPDPGVGLGQNNRLTANDVDDTRKTVTARFTNNAFLNGLFITLAAPESDTRARATTVGANVEIRDPSILVGSAVNDPDGALSDSALAMTFNIGDLVAGATAKMRYFILFGNGAGQVDAMLNAINTNTGAGHLVADSSQAATETLSDGSSVAQYPYRYYYPEGFFGPNIFNFLPMANPNSQTANVVVIQRFEFSDTELFNFPARQALRDRVVASFQIEPFRRRGVDVNTPQMYLDTLRFLPQVTTTGDSNGDGIPDGRPYAIEIRSDRPIAPTFSYYDLTQIPSGPVAVGESFGIEPSANWTFADVQKSTGASVINSYIIFQNPGEGEAKITIRAFDTTSGRRFRTTRVMGGSFDTPSSTTIQRSDRSGVFMSDPFWDDESTIEEENLFLPDGTYGVVVNSLVPIIAAKTTYNPSQRQATGTVGAVGSGSTTGVLTEGQFGLRNSSETVGVLNATNAPTQVTFSFVFANGSAYRTVRDVAANSHISFNVSSLPNFITGQAYSLVYESTQPVSVSMTVPLSENAFNDALSVTDAKKAYSYWGFGEGFRPGDNTDWSPQPGNQPHPGVTENLRIYNPGTDPVVVEITLSFDLNPGTETYRRTIPGRRVAEFNVEDFISPQRRFDNQSYGIQVKAANPVVVEMNHYDRLFPGAFATLGTPLGRSSSIG